MLITEKMLRKAGACDGVNKYFSDINRKRWDAKELLDYAISKERYEDAAYGIAYLMTERQAVEWSIYCAESCLHIFEEAHPSDTRPREAIEAAKAYLAGEIGLPQLESARSAAWLAAELARSAARSAARAAWAAADSADSADSAWAAADSAADSADSAWAAAWLAARSAVWSAESAESAAWSAAWSAVWSAESAAWLAARSAARAAARSAVESAYKDLLTVGLEILLRRKV